MYRLVRRETAGLQAQQFPVHDVIERGTQAAMVVILKRDEAERLQYTVVHLLRGAEDFRHSMYRPGLRLEGNFNEVALRQAGCELQQAASNGNGLEFSFGAAAVF